MTGYTEVIPVNPTQKRAEELRDEMRKQIPSIEKLFEPVKSYGAAFI